VRSQVVAVRELLVERARWRSRRAKARRVREAFARWESVDRVLLVGAGQGWTPLDTVVERAAAEGAKLVVATDLHERSVVPWPYLRADGLRLPFADGSFDVVLSNAVIEHVGDEAQQRAFVAEHLRVARHFVITTPNRWFPMETHTRAVLRHWSRAWRDRQAPEFTRLLSRSELRALVPESTVITGRPWNSTFIAFSR
jgi:2-polyprenyl-3-methyl-5-hydroxy-6-metoxy-1,4-benzoquinol methylase